MSETISILDGNTFVVSDRRGDIEATPVDNHGLFLDDTRFLSQWILTVDGDKRVLFRDAQAEYQVKDKLDLRMFDLIPTNETTSTIFGVTSDGSIVAAIPK